MKDDSFTISIDTVPSVIGAMLALGAFTVAVLVGMLIGNPAPVTLARALACMVVAMFAGRLLGWAGIVSAREIVEKYREAHPHPDMPEELVQLQRKQAEHAALQEKMKKAA